MLACSSSPSSNILSWFSISWVLLLGATGNFASRYVPALAHKHQVVVFVRSYMKVRDLLPSSILSEITIVAGNATDSSAIEDSLVQSKCEALINSAGLSATPWAGTSNSGDHYRSSYSGCGNQ